MPLARLGLGWFSDVAFINEEIGFLIGGFATPAGGTELRIVNWRGTVLPTADSPRFYSEPLVQGYGYGRIHKSIDAIGHVFACWHTGVVGVTYNLNTGVRTEHPGCEGSSPICFGGPYAAIQGRAGDGYPVKLLILGSGIFTGTLRFGKPTGLARVEGTDAAPRIIDMDENRFLYAGGTQPDFDQDFAVAEGQETGTQWRLQDGHSGTLFAGELAYTPKCARGPRLFGVTAGGGPGIRLFVGDAAELIGAPTQPGGDPALSARVTALEAKVSSLQTSDASQNTSLVTLQNTDKSHDQTIATIQKTDTNQGTTIANHESRIKALETGGGGGGNPHTGPMPGDAFEHWISEAGRIGEPFIHHDPGDPVSARAQAEQGARQWSDQYRDPTHQPPGLSPADPALGEMVFGAMVRSGCAPMDPSQVETLIADIRTTQQTLIGPTTPPVTITALHTDGMIFRDAGGAPVRLRGFSGFKLARMFADGQDTKPILAYFRGLGANAVRVWPYVPWAGTGWAPPSNDDLLAFIRFARAEGYRTYLTLLTDDDPSRIPWAQNLVAFLAGQSLDCLLLEIGNEPQINKHIDTHALKAACDASGYLYTSGEYDDSAQWFGSFGDAHTPRDSEWPRKMHDLHEYYVGGGPSYPEEPATKKPWWAGEPMKPTDAGFVETDYLAYFGGCAILGSGGFFHYEGGKFGQMPTADEQRCAVAAFQGLTYFPDDAPHAGPYERIDEQGATLRTYKKGPFIVRVRPTSGPILQGNGAPKP